MVWSGIRLVMAKFRSQSIRKPDLITKKYHCNLKYVTKEKYCYYSYIEFCDSMVFLAGKATKHMCWERPAPLLKKL